MNQIYESSSLKHSYWGLNKIKTLFYLSLLFPTSKNISFDITTFPNPFKHSIYPLLMQLLSSIEYGQTNSYSSPPSLWWFFTIYLLLPHIQFNILFSSICNLVSKYLFVSNTHSYDRDSQIAISLKLLDPNSIGLLVISSNCYFLAYAIWFLWRTHPPFQKNCLSPPLFFLWNLEYSLEFNLWSLRHDPLPIKKKPSPPLILKFWTEILYLNPPF